MNCKIGLSAVKYFNDDLMWVKKKYIGSFEKYEEESQ